MRIAALAVGADGRRRGGRGVEGPALLLKYAAPDLPDRSAREVLDPIPAIVAKELRIRWLPVPLEPSGKDPSAGEIPVPDDAALRRIAGKVSRASEQMDKVEGAAAERILEEAEKECRSYRFTEATRPFLAEIFLRRGILRLWEGKTSDAEALLSRVRALRPGFTPDPALFPPQVMSAWEAIRQRPVPEAELLVESLPSGAEIFVDGERRGVTPARVRTKNIAPVRIRVSHTGYRDAEATGQWLPGDTEILRFSLPGDRVARLGELLAGAAQGKGGGAGPLVEELSAAAGTSRVAILMLEKEARGEGLRARLYAGRPAEPGSGAPRGNIVPRRERGGGDLREVGRRCPCRGRVAKRGTAGEALVQIPLVLGDPPGRGGGCRARGGWGERRVPADPPGAPSR